MKPRTACMPRVVRGCSPTSWGFDGAGAPSRLALRGLVGGLLFALALLVPGLARADFLLLEWAPVGPLVDLSPSAEVAFYALERRGDTGWERIAEVRHSASDPHFRYDRGTFVAEVPAGEYRLVAVDAVGNQSPPSVFDPGASGCTWEVAGGAVPVVCAVPCACAEVLPVLDEARREIVRAYLVDAERLDAALLRLTAIAVVAPERLLTPAGQRVGGMYGSDPRGREYIYLRPDLGAALHEMVHAAHGPCPVGSPTDHPAWERDPRLQELDLRFQEHRRRAR